ncbi:MAG: hypothetical protein GY748_07540 [Planctomycetaceae bacterium]|nr:hypothetical protein [Planctomycetaceae bacterium]
MNNDIFTFPGVSTVLSPVERAVLGLGLKYVPRYAVKPSSLFPEYAAALFKFVRNIKWRVYYGPSSSDEQPLYPCVKSNNPLSVPDSEAAIQNTLDVYLSACESRLQTCLSAAINIQLSTRDQLIMDTFESLSNRSDVIFKPADKNLGTTVMFVDQYNKMCTDILADTTTYQVIQTYDPNRLYTCLLKILQKHKQHGSWVPRLRRFVITPLARSLLQLQDSTTLRVPAFYCLPKMHKPGPTKGRPIVSSINSVTYHASLYLHNYLVQLRPYIPNIVTNSADVILQMEGLRTDDPDLVVVCADVASLYPSIPIDFGLQAVRNFLLGIHLRARRGERIPVDVSPPQIDLIVDLLEWVLTNNYLQFMGVIYHQLTGTAMGTPAAVMYADIVLAYLERPVLNKVKPLYYGRYLDDIFSLLHRKDKDNLIQLFNQRCAAIQLDGVTHGTSGVFLDLEISISVNSIHPTTKLYQKPTNRFMYITPHSSHNPAVFRNLVVTELKRYRLHCSEDADFLRMARLFYERLIARGYTTGYLDLLYEDLPRREDLLQDLKNRVTRRQEKRRILLGDRTNVDPSIVDSSDSVLVYVPCIYNRALRIPWHDILQLPPDVTNDVDMQLAYNVDNLRTVVGAKNPRNAAYFLSRLRNLLPTTPISTLNPTHNTTIPKTRVTNQRSPNPNANAFELKQTAMSDFFPRR